MQRCASQPPVPGTGSPPCCRPGVGGAGPSNSTVGRGAGSPPDLPPGSPPGLPPEPPPDPPWPPSSGVSPEPPGLPAPGLPPDPPWDAARAPWRAARVAHRREGAVTAWRLAGRRGEDEWCASLVALRATWRYRRRCGVVRGRGRRRELRYPVHAAHNQYADRHHGSDRPQVTASPVAGLVDGRVGTDGQRPLRPGAPPPPGSPGDRSLPRWVHGGPGSPTSGARSPQGRCPCLTLHPSQSVSPAPACPTVRRYGRG